MLCNRSLIKLGASAVRRSRFSTSSTAGAAKSLSSFGQQQQPHILINHDRINGVERNIVRHHNNLGTASYQGDGKTTVTILNHEIDSPLMVDSYTQSGFRLNNGMTVVGPIALFPKTVLGWDVGCAADITPESLSLFTTLEPKLDILVIGIGNDRELNSATFKFLRDHKIAVEALPTEYACQIFNFLNVERRCVAAALIPPGSITDAYMDSELQEKLRKKKLYETD